MQAGIKALVLAGLAIGTLGHSRTQERASLQSQCDISLEVTGGKFSPNSCVLEIISGGPFCEPASECPPDYVLDMKDLDRSDIRQVLLKFGSLTDGTFRFDPNEGVTDFNGQLVDSRRAVRNLVEGEVSLESLPSAQQVRISLNVSFADGITVRGQGVVPRRHVSAP